MIKVKDMSTSQRKVFDACNNGWYMGGKYSASFDEHKRNFFADSRELLFKAVDEWYESHLANHADAHMLVRCVEVR